MRLSSVGLFVRPAETNQEHIHAFPARKTMKGRRASLTLDQKNSHITIN
jgi:hypothetical protein